MWTEERVAELRRHWAAGLSGGEIAALMEVPTRNAVIGKAHRLGLPSRGPSTKPRKKPSSSRPKHSYQDARWANGSEPRAAAPTPKPVAPTPKPVALPPPPAPEPVPAAMVAFADLEPHHCRYIPGEPAGEHTMCCGAPAVLGKPYCEAHVRRTSNAVQPTKPPPAWRDIPRAPAGISSHYALALVRG